MNIKTWRQLALAAFFLPVCLQAEEAPQLAAQPFDAAAFEASLHYQTGTVTLPDGKAVLNLGDKFRYLSPADTSRVLEEAWGNPHSEPTQGMIVPATLSPVQPDGWAVVVEYEDSGYVSDKDAADIDYDDLLADMKKSTTEDNAAREKAGYETVDLLGWASKPYYDNAGKRLHWAKELKFASSEGSTLNYNIRVLGREGVLVLNAVAGMGQFAAIKPELDEIVKIAEFTPGNRYADFNEATDRKAEYGLAALVAGGVAAKAGWLAPILLAFKKFFVLILLGLGWLGKKVIDIFRGGSAKAA